MADYPEYLLKTPVPVPTPYQSPQNGGNPYIAPGTQGPSIGPKEQPVASSDGYTQFAGGAVYPNSQVKDTPKDLPKIETRYASKPVDNAGNMTTVVNNPTKLTESQALQNGLDVNQLRREGRLIEEKKKEEAPNIGGYSYNASNVSDWRRAAERAGKDVNSEEFRGLREAEERYYAPFRQQEEALRRQEEALRRQQEEQRARTRGTIESGYNNIFARFDQMAGLIPDQQKQDEAALGTNYDSQAAGIGNDYASQLKLIDTYRQDVANRKKASLNDLATNMRNMLNAGNTMLGSYGAGDSSAVDMYKYALAKQSDRSAAQLQNQANSQFTELDRKIVDVTTARDNAKQQLDQWKASSLDAIRQSARAKLDQINNAKINADQQKLQALTSLETNVLAQTAAELNNLEQYNRQYSMQLDTWVRDRMSALQDYKLKLSQSAQFSPKDLVTEALSGLNPGQFQGATQDAFYNPMAFGLNKKKENQF